ncbi:MAG: glycosyltransferase [Flavobacteriales bacterium]|nr:glycosyltransferase [Flavobacteriales bacterium]
MSPKALWLFTRQFPEGKGEAFLESALPVWREVFSEVRIFPMFAGEGRVQLPSGIQEERLWSDAFSTASVLETAANVGAFWHLLSNRDPRRSIPLGELPEAISHARQLIHKAQVVEQRSMPAYDPDRVVLLSTWMEDWVNVLALLRRKHPALRFSTMAHGWDLYEHRRRNGTIPYRSAQMAAVDQVLCISDPGAAHLAQRFPAMANKVRITHLGTQDHGAGPWEPSGTLRVVSCAYLRHPKRIDKLARALARIQRPVHWVHFGDGPDLSALHALVKGLPPHITVELPGSVANAAVLHHYRTRPVDVFALISEDEGVPVSLMEAASFGIPLLANDVGGVRAVVTAESGVLLAADADEERIAEGVLDAASRSADPERRADVRKFWQQHFFAPDNYRRIGALLMQQ